MKRTVVIRLWARLLPDRETGCLLWTGSQTNTGYGHMHVGNATRMTHRVAYELLVGPIPEGLVLDHLCRRPLCANPAHLQAVTMAENVRRGNGPAAAGARMRAKTHCPAGHEYDAANTYVRPDGRGRTCRQCNLTASNRYRERRTATA